MTLMTPFTGIGLLAAAVLLATACSVAESDRSELERDGVSIELPDGWDGRLLADDSSAVLQAANFKLLPVGTTELPAGEKDPIKAMTAENVLVTIVPCGLVSWEDAANPAPEHITLEELSYLPASHPRLPSGHAFAYRSFLFEDRCLRIEVDFGAAPPSRMLKEMVNEVLASLSVTR